MSQVFVRHTLIDVTGAALAIDVVHTGFVSVGSRPFVVSENRFE